MTQTKTPTVKCPRCNKRCYEKSFRGSMPHLFDKAAPNKTEEGASKLLGMPITHYEPHKCS